jgi:hypothetical protein
MSQRLAEISNPFSGAGEATQTIVVPAFPADAVVFGIERTDRNEMLGSPVPGGPDEGNDLTTGENVVKGMGQEKTGTVARSEAGMGAKPAIALGAHHHPEQL